MEKLYRITPLEKKSMEYFVDVFERLPDGRIRGFDVTEIWRWGYGFREEDEPVWRFEAEGRVNCRPEVGWGCELDDLIAVYVNFGTVWGIMNAFRGLANVQQATLASVAPGIAEALVASEIGLFAAIPAVVAYNRSAADIDRLSIRFETFIEEFSNILQRQQQVR